MCLQHQGIRQHEGVRPLPGDFRRCGGGGGGGDGDGTRARVAARPIRARGSASEVSRRCPSGGCVAALDPYPHEEEEDFAEDDLAQVVAGLVVLKLNVQAVLNPNLLQVQL